MENPILKKKNQFISLNIHQLGNMVRAGKGLIEVITVNLCYND